MPHSYGIRWMVECECGSSLSLILLNICPSFSMIFFLISYFFNCLEILSVTLNVCQEYFSTISITDESTLQIFEYFLQKFGSTYSSRNHKNTRRVSSTTIQTLPALFYQWWIHWRNIMMFMRKTLKETEIRS